MFLLIKDGSHTRSIISTTLYRHIEIVDCDVTSLISIYSPSPTDLYHNYENRWL
jgi:hypothetical protein